MKLPDILNGLKLDAWYKLLAYTSSFIFIPSFFIELKGISNFHAQVFFFGVMLMALGFWANHKVSDKKNKGKASKNTASEPQEIWSPNPIGGGLLIMGTILLIFAIILMVRGHGPI